MDEKPVPKLSTIHVTSQASKANQIFLETILSDNEEEIDLPSKDGRAFYPDNIFNEERTINKEFDSKANITKKNLPNSMISSPKKPLVRKSQLELGNITRAQERTLAQTNPVTTLTQPMETMEEIEDEFPVSLIDDSKQVKQF